MSPANVAHNSELAGWLLISASFQALWIPMNSHATIEAVREPSAGVDAAYATAADTSSIACGLPVREPLPYAPADVLSLWDMLQLYGEDFLLLTTELTTIESVLAD